MEDIKISYLLLFLICTITLSNCKSDKKAIESSPEQSNHIDNLESRKQDSTQLIDNIGERDTSILSTEIDSSSAESLPIEESKKDAIQKSKTTSATRKKRKAYSNKKAKIEFEELTWNFGEITEGDIIDKKFKFTNTGNAPLQIIATSATCGCTRPTFPFLDIAPGESNVIGVNYNSVGKNGEQNPEVTIESNTNPKITTIKLHGTVKPKPKDKDDKKSDTNIAKKDTSSTKQ